MIQLSASRNDLTARIIFKTGETLSHNNYIEVVLSHTKFEGEWLLGVGHYTNHMKSDKVKNYDSLINEISHIILFILKTKDALNNSHFQ